jgi:hypothetical protein
VNYFTFFRIILFWIYFYNSYLKNCLRIPNWLSEAASRRSSDNGKKKRDKRSNIYLQNIRQKTEDGATRTLQETAGKVGCLYPTITDLTHSIILTITV